VNGLIAALAQYGFVISVVIVAVVWWRLPRPQKLELLVTVAIGSLLCLLLIKVGGALYYDTRPFVTQHVAPLFAHSADNGFPSDHTVLTMFLALCVLYYSRPWGFALIGVSLITGAARVLAHVHTPVDILGAVAMAVVAAVLAHALVRWAGARLARARDA
jgi:undecaprenyl-diphosphatase